MNSDHKGILTDKKQLGPFPMEKLKRVDQPTTLITGNIQRFDMRENGFNQARRGDFGTIVSKELLRPPKYPVNAVEAEMSRHLTSMSIGEVALSKAPIPEDPEILSRHIKSLGHFFRADILGICRLPQYAVYSHDMNGNTVELNHQFAIVVLVDQDYATMNASTGSDWISSSQSHRSYSATAFITCMMANYIKRLGYPARAHYSGNYQVIMPPLLLQAGIGELSRMGNSVINPFLGPRFKAAAVTTNLPLLPDKPVDFGLQEFCQKCMKCAVECPPRAIPMGDKVMYNGYECWKLDIKRCTKFRLANPNGVGCGTCIKVCPWNKPSGWLHDRVRWMARHTPWLDKFILKMDGIMDYGKPHPTNKWWFDLEEIDGVLQIPKEKRKGIPNKKTTPKAKQITSVK